MAIKIQFTKGMRVKSTIIQDEDDMNGRTRLGTVTFVSEDEDYPVAVMLDGDSCYTAFTAEGKFFTSDEHVSLFIL